jgi:ABC-type dipeptide/oligopeptide/nickel transport system ATPase component
MKPILQLNEHLKIKFKEHEFKKKIKKQQNQTQTNLLKSVNFSSMERVLKC